MIETKPKNQLRQPWTAVSSYLALVSTVQRDESQVARNKLSTVAAVDSRFGLYHVAVVLSLSFYAVSALALSYSCLFSSWSDLLQILRKLTAFSFVVPCSYFISKNNPTCENAVSQTRYVSCTLRVMGSCRLQVLQILTLAEQQTSFSKPVFKPDIYLFPTPETMRRLVGVLFSV